MTSSILSKQEALEAAGLGSLVDMARQQVVAVDELTAQQVIERQDISSWRHINIADEKAAGAVGRDARAQWERARQNAIVFQDMCQTKATYSTDRHPDEARAPKRSMWSQTNILRPCWIPLQRTSASWLMRSPRE